LRSQASNGETELFSLEWIEEDAIREGILT
jgi:hypothetical protein